MAEKEVMLQSVKSKPVKAKSEKPEKPKSTADLLLDNFVSLQSIMADLAIKTTRLNNQLSKILGLFEEAAKDFKERKIEHKEEKTSLKPSSELTSKIDRVIEQNKTIARGLSLMGQMSKTKELDTGASEESREKEMEETGKVKAKPLPEFRF